MQPLGHSKESAGRPHRSGSCRRTRRSRRRSVFIAALSLALVGPGVSDAAGAVEAVVPSERLFLVRSVVTSELGLAQAEGLAYSPFDAALLVAGASGPDTTVIRLTDGEDVVSSSALPPGAAQTLAFDQSTNAVTMMTGDELVSVPGGELARHRPLERRRQFDEVRVGAPAGAAFDAAGDLLVLDAASRDIVRIEGADPTRRITRIPLGHLGDEPLRGLAVNPDDGLVYVGAPSRHTLEGVDERGRVRSVYDLSGTGVADPQAFVFAPTADPTDAPAKQGLFVSDGAESAGAGRVAELSLTAPVAPAATREPSALVQSISTSQWDPPSPDPAGIVYLPETGRLLVSDSEVDEMPIFEGANLFETTLTGSLQATASTIEFSSEPTGVSYRASDGTLFVSDDDADRVTWLRSGPDRRYGTADDIRGVLPTQPFAGDAEDVAYDSVSGDLFILDGIGREVYRVNDGPSGVFGDGDDVWSNFDIEQHGVLNPEGIAHDLARDTLLVVDQPTHAVYELTKTGALLRLIDLRPTGSIAAAGISIAPSSVHPDRTNLWIVDRGVDNAIDPNENDGALYELAVGSDGNTAPVVDSVTIQPSSPDTDDVLTANASAHDPDGDPIILRYQWRKNGIALPGANGRTLDLSVPGHGDGGDVISVRVVAFDFIVEGPPRTSAQVTIRLTSPPPGSGYWMLGFDGTVYGFGQARTCGNLGITTPALELHWGADIAATPNGLGYWVLDAAGSVSFFDCGMPPGDAGTYERGNEFRDQLRAGERAISVSSLPDGTGYWVFTNQGRALPFGRAQWFGDMGAVVLNGPVLGSVATPSGLGYWMVATDGGIFSFGDAQFHGSMGGRPLNRPIMAIAPDPDEHGYWLVAGDGGIFAFDAPFHGSMGGVALNQPVTGMVESPTGAGYLMVAADGGIFAFGDVPFHGSLGESPPFWFVTSVAPVP